MGLLDKDGRDIKDIWTDNGIRTYMGLGVHGFPNMFFACSPQAPTLLANGPTTAQCQVDCIVDAIRQLEAEGITRIEPTEAAQDDWCAIIDGMSEAMLITQTKSWWTASHLKGAKPQSLLYTGGIPLYEKQVRETLGGEWKGYDIVKRG